MLLVPGRRYFKRYITVFVRMSHTLKVDGPIESSLKLKACSQAWPSIPIYLPKGYEEPRTAFRLKHDLRENEVPGGVMRHRWRQIPGFPVKPIIAGGSHQRCVL